MSGLFPYWDLIGRMILTQTILYGLFLNVSICSRFSKIFLRSSQRKELHYLPSALVGLAAGLVAVTCSACCFDAACSACPFAAASGSGQML